MKKLKSQLIVLVVVLVSLLVHQGVAAALSMRVYLPLVYGGPVATPLPTPVPTAVPTAIPAQVQAGTTVHVKDWLGDIPFSGVVIVSTFQSVLIPTYGSPVYPQGKFLVVVMDLTNTGTSGGYLGMYNSFKAKDTSNRNFDLAQVAAQSAAMEQYGLEGVYRTVQPGFTTRMVFVFDVLPASNIFTLVSLSSW